VAVQPLASGAREGPLRLAVSGSAFNPPPRSIAVLPFVNLSGEKEQEYFSDGLTEELLSALSRINELQVAAQTSSFYFKGKDVDLDTIARKLNVGTVLEGSVRRTGHSVRITAQLINSNTGYHLWSQTYDRNLRDIVGVQIEIANAVASALKITLLGDVAAKIGLGGTQNPAAFDAYIRALRTASAQHGQKDIEHAIAGYTEAIRQDPHYALAFAGRSFARRFYTAVFATALARPEGWDKVQVDARKAVALAPDLADGHVALALFLENTFDFTRASDEYERALALAPSNARALRHYGLFAVCMGRSEAGLAAARRAVVLDPLDRLSHYNLGWALFYARQYKEALAAFQHSAALDPDFDPFSGRGFAYYVLGDYHSARANCKSTATRGSQMCLALTYHKLGQYADAEATLAKLQDQRGDAAAYEYAGIYAQWANSAQALDRLEAAVRLRDDRLEQLRVDPLLDPVRNEPRFQAIERQLKFPN
jgi:TolB-like protein